MKVNWKPIRKITASFLSGVTVTGLVALADGLGWHLDQTVAGAVVGGIAILTGYLVPSPAAPPAA